MPRSPLSAALATLAGLGLLLSGCSSPNDADIAAEVAERLGGYSDAAIAGVNCGAGAGEVPTPSVTPTAPAVTNVALTTIDEVIPVTTTTDVATYLSAITLYRVVSVAPLPEDPAATPSQPHVTMRTVNLEVVDELWHRLGYRSPDTLTAQTLDSLVDESVDPATSGPVTSANRAWFDVGRVYAIGLADLSQDNADQASRPEDAATMTSPVIELLDGAFVEPPGATSVGTDIGGLGVCEAAVLYREARPYPGTDMSVPVLERVKTRPTS